MSDAVRTSKALAGHPVTWLTVFMLIVPGYEGYFGRPYRDIVGVWTQCYGETEGIGPNSPPRDEPYCRSLLALKALRYHHDVMKCIHVPLTPYAEGVLTSLAYNIGVRGACRSQFVAALNRLEPKACDRLLNLDHAGRRRVRGLTIRRKDERRWCYRTAGIGSNK